MTQDEARNAARMVEIGTEYVASAQGVRLPAADAAAAVRAAAAVNKRVQQLGSALPLEAELPASTGFLAVAGASDDKR